MAEEKGILATTPQRTTAILQVHFSMRSWFCTASQEEKKPSVTVKHTKTLSKYQKESKRKNREPGKQHSNLPAFHYNLSYNF